MDGVSPAPGLGAAPRLGKRRPDALLLRLLVYVEYGLLYVVAVVLLGLGCGVLGRALGDMLRGQAAWTERFISVLEELLLVMIILEIFLTVLTHLQGGRLQLEPFIVVAIIGVVRHILSIVVMLAIPETPSESRIRL